LQCQTPAAPPQQKICEMEQVAQVQGKNIPFSRVSIAHPTKGESLHLFAQVPVNVSSATNVTIENADAGPGAAAPFTRYTPAGCFADFEVKDDVLKKSGRRAPVAN
jgi:invasion protein IalB